jgi:tRNA nucleotidyltransferase/poly(A) polymerase
MAYALYSGKIIDCVGGMEDLAAKKIRMVSEKVFREDPIRLVRAFRIGAMFDFEIEPQTLSCIRNEAKLIQNSSGERIQAEFFKMLCMRKSYYYLSQMADVRLLFEIFPELGALKGCQQNRYHLYDVFEHTMKAYYHLEAILNKYTSFMSEFMHHNIPDMDEDKTALNKYSILLHDIGKPSTRTVDEKGGVHFHGHGAKSADMAKKISKRLKLSSRKDRYIACIIRNHLRPLLLFEANRQKTLTRKGITRFFMKCGGNTPDILLHSIADMMGKESDRNKAFLEFAKDLMRKYYFDFQPKMLKSPLISGHDLMDTFQLAPSSLFKTIIDHVEEARLSGIITNRQDALNLVKDFLKSGSPDS